MSSSPCMSRMAALITLVLAAPLAAHADTRSDLNAAWKQELDARREQEISFGNDVDVGGKLFDLAKTYVDKFGLPRNALPKIKAAAVNAVDLMQAQQSGGMSEDDVAIFLAKTVLPYMDKSDLAGIGLSPDSVKWLAENGANYAEPLGKAAGRAAADSGWVAVGKELTLGGVDALCPQCAVARRAVLVAYESGRAVEAWVQDSSVQAEFERFLAEGAEVNGRLPVGVLAGQQQMANSARAAFIRKYGFDPTRAQVDAFIQDQFDRWKDARTRKIEEEAALLEAAEAFARLPVWERRALGRDPAAQAARFAADYLEVWRDLKAARAQGCKEFPRDILASESTRLLVRRRSATALEYRKHYFDTLEQLGCEVARPATPEADRRAHIRDRFLAMNHDRVVRVLEAAGLTFPQDLGACLCDRAGYHSRGVAASYYSPGPKGMCDSPGAPCIVAGSGCSRHPLVNARKSGAENARIMEACLDAARLSDGSRLDERLSEVLRR